jgi:hypothetical protein
MNYLKLTGLLLLLVSVDASAQNIFPYPAAGNVGIGTTTPTSLLQIRENTDSRSGGINASTKSVL